MKNIAVFASGKGTNLQAIIDAVDVRRLKARIALVAGDRAGALALKRAKKAGIRTLYLAPGAFATKRRYEERIIQELRKENVDFVVLAGFMRILSPFFVKAYKNRILNIHPSLLPAFPGRDAIKKAFSYGVKMTGVTVHLVDDEVDHGPIVMQESVPIGGSESLSELEAKIHSVEHRIYPLAIARVLSGDFVIKGRRVVFP